MFAEPPIVSDIKSAHDDAIAQVNCWRGHCLELFARIELALAETLAANQRTVPQAISAKLDAVADLADSKKLTATIDRVRNLTDSRNAIVHAASSVWIGAKGEWLWAFRFIPTGKDKAAIEGHWDHARAQAFSKALSAARQSLCDQLRSLSREGSAKA